MPKIEYVTKRFEPETRELISKAEEICDDYADRGYELTLRQLYYQFVSRDWIPNTEKSYKRLGVIVSDARMAGLLDWDHLTDRTRSPSLPYINEDMRGIIHSIQYHYANDLWDGQDDYVEVWVEKDALSDVVSRATDRWEVGSFACRGYVSSSEMWSAANRLGKMARKRNVTILHLGDHDPSGQDMTRDIEDRLADFIWNDYREVITVERIALNMDQIKQYDPPPNPAKAKDARFTKYQEEYGDQSWELDALDPKVIDDLITKEIRGLVDVDMFNANLQIRKERREVLQKMGSNWDKVRNFIESLED